MTLKCSFCGANGHTVESCEEKAKDLFAKNREQAGINFAKFMFIPVATICPDQRCGKCSKLGVAMLEVGQFGCKCVVPRDGIKPVKDFAKLGLNEQMLANSTQEDRMGFEVLTPIQQHALPVILRGYDIMGCAQTGTGKTAAYLIPIIKFVTERGFRKTKVRNDEPQKPQVLILAPTRELAIQIKRFAEQLGFGINPTLGIEVIFGGETAQKQRHSVRQGCNILIATPGRLLQFVEEYTVSLENIEFLVLDEADKMVDDGFRGDLERIVEQTGMPEKEYRQTLLFSATFRSDLQEIAAASMKKDYRIVRAGKIGSAQPDVKQRFELFDTEQQKLPRLKEILVDLHSWSEKRFLEHMGQNEVPTIGDYFDHILGKCCDLRILIFVEKRRDAEDIAECVSEHLFNFYRARFQNKFNVASLDSESQDELFGRCGAVVIHGRMRQRDRIEALDSFKEGFRPILVSTNVAARGIHIEHVTHVINYDLPLDLSTIERYREPDTQALKAGKIKRRPIRDQFEEYIHRIGRTGRAGNEGVSISFFNKAADRHLAISFIRMLEIAQQEPPEWLLEIAEEQANVRNAGKEALLAESLAGMDIKEETMVDGPGSEELWGDGK